MKLRSLLITMLVIFAMVLGGVAAQDTPMDSCMDLSADDCAVITAAEANGVGDATSFTVSLDFSLDAAGIPDETMPSASFAMSGSVDVAPGAGMMVPVNAAGSIDLNSELIGPPMSLQFALVDDFAYFTDPTSASGDWLGVDVVALLSSDEFSSMFDGLMSGDMSSLGLGEMPDASTFMPLMSVLDLPGLMSYERNGDDFVFTIDLTALQALNDPENADLLAEIDAALTEADPSLEGMAAALPMLLRDGTIQVTQSVNTDLNIVDNVSITANIALVLGTDPTTLDLSLNVGLSNFDDVAAPEAPAEFTDMTDMITGTAASGQ